MTHRTTQARRRERGITLLIATIITGTLLLVTTAIMNIVVKQQYLAQAGEQSQQAFYAADSGMECAIYWDAKFNAFATTSSMSSINCNGQSIPTQKISAQTDFIVNYDTPTSPCADVNVTKNTNGTTQIESKGYNTCDLTNPRRVERAVSVTY